jgi:glycogen phosphorylase
VRAHVVFLDDYDMRLATELVQGVDVWINTPRRPWEASGTSGMKVLVNGGLNLSTLDGWWAEAYDAEYGWALGDRVERPDDDVQEAAQLYSLLEQEVIPAFYERDAEGFPRRWIARMRASTSCLAPRFSSVRMLQEYVERAYLPAASSFRRRAARENGVAQSLERWSRHLGQHWSRIRFGEVTALPNERELTVSLPVFLGEIDGDSVRVELYADPENAEDSFVQRMLPVEAIPGVPHAFVYRATIDTARPPGDFTVRAVPYHPDLRVPIECPLVAWQR